MRIRMAIGCCGIFLSVGLVHADEKPSGGTANENEAANSRPERSAKETIVYPVRGVPAGELAATLADVFDESELRVVAEPISNLLIIQVSADSRVTVVELLEKLDTPLRSMVVQLHLLKTRGKDLEPLDTKALSGPHAEVMRKIRELEAAGRIYVANRMELTVVDNQNAMLQVGERVAVVTGQMSSRGGSPVNSYTNHDVGTMISVTTRVSDDDAITMQLAFEKSEIVEAEKKDDEAAAFAPSSTSTLVQQTTVVLRNGHSTLAATLVARSPGADHEEAYLVVGATLLEANAFGKPITFRSFSQRDTAANRSPSPPRAAGEGVGRARGIDERYVTYARAFLNRYDKNKDGVLTSDEWKSMSRDPSAADTNDDKKISVEELVSWLTNDRPSR